MSNKPIDPVDEIRRNLGIKDDEGPKFAGVGNDPALTYWEQRQIAYQAEMEFLSQGGNNASGNEAWRKLMRGVGRG